jgi:hypothetical protein
MRIDDLLLDEIDLDEWRATKKLCTSGKPNHALGASALASCKSQGYRKRSGRKSHKIGSKRVTVGGKKIRGAKYGGPLPHYGSGPVKKSKRKSKKRRSKSRRSKK